MRGPEHVPEAPRQPRTARGTILHLESRALYFPVSLAAAHSVSFIESSLHILRFSPYSVLDFSSLCGQSPLFISSFSLSQKSRGIFPVVSHLRYLIGFSHLTCLKPLSIFLFSFFFFKSLSLSVSHFNKWLYHLSSNLGPKSWSYPSFFSSLISHTESR